MTYTFYHYMKSVVHNQSTDSAVGLGALFPPENCKDFVKHPWVIAAQNCGICLEVKAPGTNLLLHCDYDLKV